MCIRDYDEGMLANWGAHLHDMALWAMNLDRSGPTEIEGTGKYPPPGNLWNVIQEFEVHFAFANGVQLTTRTDKTAYIRFEGSEGWIHVHDAGSIEAEPKSLLSWKPGPNDTALTYKRSEKRDFLDCVKSRGQTLADAEVGHRAVSLCHLALTAIDLKRKIKWDPAKEQVIDDAEASRLLEPKPYRGPWKL
jgi:predicted dehydrogenase